MEDNQTEQTQPNYKVRAVHCHYQADEDEIYANLKRVTDPLDEAWEKLRKAIRRKPSASNLTRIGSKANRSILRVNCSSWSVRR